MLAASAAGADVYHLRNGDRVSGTTLQVARRSFTVQTPFDRLTIPRGRVLKIVHDDGREEVLAPAPAASAAAAAAPTPAPASPTPPPRVGSARLELAITGATFWQAWEPKQAPSDPRLRLEVRLDEELAAAFLDTQLDPADLPGATVNTFSFAEGLAGVTPATGVRASSPQVRPGRILLHLELPPARRGRRELRMAYQLNRGTTAEPSWQDVVSASAPVTLQPDRTTRVEVRQDRGRMDYGGFPRRRMRHVETFQLSLESPAARVDSTVPGS